MKELLKIQLLFDPTCASRHEVPRLVQKLLAEMEVEADVEEVMITSARQAAEVGFRGSPSILLNGKDLEPLVAGQPAFSMG